MEKTLIPVDFSDQKITLGSEQKPPIDIYAPIQVLGPDYEGADLRLRGIETADGPEASLRVKRRVVPDSELVRIKGESWYVHIYGSKILLINRLGEVLEFGHLEDQYGKPPKLEVENSVADMVDASVGSCRAPWGPLDVMQMTYDPYIHAFYDLPVSEQNYAYGMRAGILDYYQRNFTGSEIYGKCHGVGALLGENSMSVNFDHSHAAAAGRDLDPEEIMAVRQNSPWDGGISYELALKLSGQPLSGIITNHFGSGVKMGADQLGFAAIVPLTPREMVTPQYKAFEREFGLSMHEQMRQAHSFLYGQASDYNTTVRYSEKAHSNGLNPQWWSDFNTLFEPQNFNPYNEAGLSEELYNNLHALNKQERIKRPFAWEYSMAFTDKGCLVAATWATMNARNIGAIEGLGLSIKGRDKQLSKYETERVKKTYTAAVAHAEENFIY